MDRTRKYHSEWGNPITKYHIWYVPTDKYILAQNLWISTIQFTDHRKLQRKEDQSLGALLLLRRGNKLLMGGNIETKCGAKTEYKAIQRQPHLEISSIYSHQKETLLLMLWNPCWDKPYIAVSWETLPEPYKYRGGCLQQTIGQSTGSLIKKLEKGLKELKGFATL